MPKGGVQILKATAVNSGRAKEITCIYSLVLANADAVGTGANAPFA